MHAKTVLVLVLPLVLAAPPSRGDEPGASQQAGATEIRIAKGPHRLDLVADGRVVKTYRVAIGPGGPGPKRMEGDRVTPVGTYRIAGRIKGLYHQFLTVSYPNDEDRRRYRDLYRRGLVPTGVGIGNGIGIHGTGHADWNGAHKGTDWTLGCIALDDAEIDEIASLVKDGTRVVITD
jgi:murein L,D-transpeptidase YafK